MTPYARSAIKQVKAQMKEQRKERKRKEPTVNTVTKSATVMGIEARMQRIVGLEQQVVKKSLSDEERRGVAGELLREKLAAREEIARARAGQQAAIANAQGPSINRQPVSSNREAVRSVFTGDYERLAPGRSATELSSQVEIHSLEKQLAKAMRATGSEAAARASAIGEELTFARLRAAHRAGRI